MTSTTTSSIPTLDELNTMTHAAFAAALGEVFEYAPWVAEAAAQQRPFASLDALTRIRMHELVDQLWQRHQPAVVLVTHDVDEAILLSDRILVLSQGRVCLDVQVALPKPRHKAGSEFDALRTRLLAELGVVVPPAPEVSGHYGAAPVALAA